MEGSLYDQFSEHEAEPMPERKEKAFANRDDTTKPYVQNRNQQNRNQQKRTESKPIEDKSYYAWWRFVTHRQPVCGFEQSVNHSFDEVVNGHNYDEMREKYINLYKGMLNNE